MEEYNPHHLNGDRFNTLPIKMECTIAFLLAVLFGVVVQPISCQYCVPTYCSQSTSQYANLKVDHSTQNYFYLGGIFGVHDAGTSFYKCGAIRERGVHNLEAFLWAINTYKTRYPRNLKGVNIGALAFDTCSTVDRAVQQVYNLENCNVAYGNPPLEPSKVLAFVGPDRSGEAQILAPIFQNVKKTLVSHAATSALLSDGNKYPYFLRTVPSDASQAEAIINIVTQQDWKYMQLVYSTNTYGSTGAEAIVAAANASGVCIVNTQTITVQPSEAEADEIVASLVANKETTVVVLFLNGDIVRMILEAAERGAKDTKFAWIGTNSWGVNSDIVKGVEDTASGAVTLSPDSSSSEVNEFFDFMRSRKPETDDHNPWFKEYWQSKFDCYIAGEPEMYSKECDLNTLNLDDIVLDSYVPFTIMAVDAILNGIEDARRSQCQNQDTWCSGFFNSPNQLDIIYNGILRGTFPVIFNQTTGDTLSGRHIINNYRQPHGNCQTHCYRDIGSYEAASSQLQMDDIHLYDTEGRRDRNVQSSCGAYPCSVCGETTTTTTTTTTSRPNITEGPTEDLAYPPLKLRQGGWVIALIVLAGLGVVLVVLFEIYLMVKMRGGPFVQRWRTMWLGQTLLLGILLCFLTCFAFVPAPVKETCGIIRFCVGTTTAMCFAVLIVKLMIILSSKSIGYLKGVFQALMFFFAWGIQIVIDIQWLILRPPGVVRSNSSADGWVCEQGLVPHVQSLVYVMFLIVICTLIAIKSHGIITNHREGIFIGLSAGFTIPIWVAWILLGLLSSNSEFEDPSVAFGLLITATLILFIMFLPKVRQLNSMGAEGIYVEDDTPDYTPSLVPAASIAPPGPGSVMAGPGSIIGGSIYGSRMQLDPHDPLLVIPNGGVYAEPTVHHNATHSPSALYLKHPGVAHVAALNRAETASIRSAPMGYVLAKRGPSSVAGDSIYATTRVMRMNQDMAGKPGGPDGRAVSEYNYNVSYGQGTTRSNKSARNRYQNGGSLGRPGIYKREFSPSLQAHLEQYEKI